MFYGVFPPSDATISSDERFTYFIVHYLPTGVLGLVIAAIFSAAMGTLAGSLNSSASTIVNDLYRPFTGKSDERHLLRVSRLMTVLWGCVLTAVAFGARRLEDNVVNNALAIASFVSGILLGLFLLGILTRRVGQSAALVGVVAGLLAVTLRQVWNSSGLAVVRPGRLVHCVCRRDCIGKRLVFAGRLGISRHTSHRHHRNDRLSSLSRRSR